MSPFAERWLPVVGYEGSYEVSDFGRVRSLARIDPIGRRAGVILRSHLNLNGYLQVCTYKAGRRHSCLVHHLVARSFLGQCPAGKQLDHLDGDKLNNKASNLEYVSPKENTQRAIRTGRNPCILGEKHPKAKLSDAQIVEIRHLSIEGMTQRKIAELFHIGPSHVSRIIRKETRNV